MKVEVFLGSFISFIFQTPIRGTGKIDSFRNALDIRKYRRMHTFSRNIISINLTSKKKSENNPLYSSC